MAPHSSTLAWKIHGRRSLVGCSPWGREESDTTERLHFHILLSCIGEGNGNPLQCSCLENPRDGGALWAPVYGVAQSRTRLKRLSSSSSGIPSRLRRASPPVCVLVCQKAKLIKCYFKGLFALFLIFWRSDNKVKHSFFFLPCPLLDLFWRGGGGAVPQPAVNIRSSLLT